MQDNQVHAKTDVVDLDIKALVAKAKEASPQEKAEEKTAEDVLQKLAMNPASEEIKEEGIKKQEGPSEDELQKAKEEKEKAAKQLEKKVKEDAKKIDELSKAVNGDWNYKLKTLIEEGLVEDVTVTIEEGTENEQQVHLSELENIDEVTYKGILKMYKEAKKKELEEKYISVEGLDDTTKRLVELKKAGGDISELIKEDVQYIDVLTKMKESLDDENEQVRIVYHELKNKGLSDRVIKAQIQELAENFELEDFAKKVVDREISAHEKSIEDKRKQQLEQIQKEKEEQKVFQKEISAKYKEWGVDENLRKLLTQNTTVRDENGLTNTDKLYFDSIKDPERHARVAFLLNNMEAFEEFITSKKVIKNQVKTVDSLFKLNLSNVKKTDKPVSDKASSLIEKLKM